MKKLTDTTDKIAEFIVSIFYLLIFSIVFVPLVGSLKMLINFFFIAN
jgi:hypothetical protein